jgi:formyl-CoA transferase
MEAIGRADLANDPELNHNQGRVARVEEIDGAIAAWTGSRSIEEILDAMTKARVPAGRIYSAKDIAEDPHYAARDMIRQAVSQSGLSVKVPGVVPKLSGTPGTLRTPAPTLGQHTAEVLERLGYSPEDIAGFRAAGVI